MIVKFNGRKNIEVEVFGDLVKVKTGKRTLLRKLQNEEFEFEGSRYSIKGEIIEFNTKKARRKESKEIQKKMQCKKSKLESYEKRKNEKGVNPRWILRATV